MGCSRPGATGRVRHSCGAKLKAKANAQSLFWSVAVACAALAGILLGLSLLLPYWTKIVPIADHTPNSASHNETRREVELTLGIWGSCVAVQSAETDSFSGSETQAASLRSGGGSSSTCAPYYDAEVVGIRCIDLPGFTGSDSSCVRVTEEESAALCSAESPAAVLLTSDVDNGTLASEWLRIIDNACGDFAKSKHCAGVYLVSVRDRDVHAAFSGRDLRLHRVTILAVFWVFEAQRIPSSQTSNVHYGTSFYLNVIGIVLQVVAFVSARGHLRLEKDADEQLDKEFRMAIDEKPQESVSTKELEGSHKVV